MIASSTAAYAIKRIIIDRLALATSPGNELEGVQVEYAWPGDGSDTLIYGGGVTFDQPGTDDVVQGKDVLVAETATTSLYIRIVGKTGEDVRAAEARAETIGDTIAVLLRREADIAGPNTYTRIASGRGDYNQIDDGPVVVMTLRISTTAYV